MLQGYYIAKITENILVTVLSFCANYYYNCQHLYDQKYMHGENFGIVMFYINVSQSGT